MKFFVWLRAFGAAWLLAAPIACAAPHPVRSQAAPGTLRFAVYGDTRDGHAVHRKIVEQILKASPDFVIQTGDLVGHANSRAQWTTYDNITGDMRKAVPVYPTRGNHDIGGTAFEDRFTAVTSSGNKLWYSFDRGDNHFIGLAIDEETRYDAKSPQYQWLVRDLSAAHQKSRHIFVAFHVGPYSIGSHGSDLTVRETLCPLFDQYGVDVVFNGHDHIYYHTKRTTIHYIVTGGGGAPLYYPDPQKGAIAGDKWERTHNFVICDVKDGNIEINAYRDDGTPIEHFTANR